MIGPARLRALAWLAENGPVGEIPMEIGMRNIRALLRDSLAEEAGREPGLFGFTKYRASAEGLKLLAERKGAAP